MTDGWPSVYEAADRACDVHRGAYWLSVWIVIATNVHLRNRMLVSIQRQPDRCPWCLREEWI